ncbi:sorting nexin-24 isoform X2 [Phyllobates terribilis]
MKYWRKPLMKKRDSQKKDLRKCHPFRGHVTSRGWNILGKESRVDGATRREVFRIEVLVNGRKHFVEKRYSEFHALHKKLKKSIKTPEMPSKHVRNWIPKVLEQRRQGLESYLQTIIYENEELPKIFLDFLNVRHLPSLPKAESCGSIEDIESEETSKLSHQPVLLFLRDPYVLPKANDLAANVVIEGVLHGIFYPHLQTS